MASSAGLELAREITMSFPLFKEGESVIRLSLSGRLVNLSPVAQRTSVLTNGVVDRPWVVGREFESHVHHENAFQRKVYFLMSRI